MHLLSENGKTLGLCSGVPRGSELSSGNIIITMGIVHSSGNIEVVE